MYDTHDENYGDFELAERLNKSQQKREIAALLALGKKLSKLDAVALEKLELPADLHKALLAVQSMKHGAEKRQYKLICKLLRQIDTEAFLETVSDLDSKKEEQDKNFHRTERWRDRLMAEGQDAVTEFMDRYPQADAGQIRQLVRNAHKEILQNKPHRSVRLLFRLLREVICQ